MQKAESSQKAIIYAKKLMFEAKDLHSLVVDSEDLRKNIPFRAILASSAAFLGKFQKLVRLAESGSAVDDIFSLGDDIIDSRDELIKMIQEAIRSSHSV